jgi:hypothetical protein
LQHHCIGSLDGRLARALQSWPDFFNGRPSYLLSFWEEADTYQAMLQSSLQRLCSIIGVPDVFCALNVTKSSCAFHKRCQSAINNTEVEKFSKSNHDWNCPFVCHIQRNHILHNSPSLHEHSKRALDAYSLWMKVAVRSVCSPHSTCVLSCQARCIKRHNPRANIPSFSL